MALELVKLDSATLPGIADAIRAKTGGTALLLPSEMAAAIAGIPTGGSLPALTKPAAESDVLAGKEYIDGNGNKRAGTLVVCDTVAEVDTFGSSGVGVNVEIESTADGSTKMLTLPEPNLVAENIVVGSSIFGVPGTAKTLRVESGSITPAEGTKAITIPCTDGAKAVCLEADAATIGAVEGQAKTRYVTSVLANFCGKIAGATNAAMYIWNLTKYADSGVLADNANGFYISSNMSFYPGAYRWTAYYWEDT